MESSKTQQSTDLLSFNLFNRPVHPELFNIYRNQQFFQGDYEVNIWLTGCSHVISVYHTKHCMTELICSPEQLLPTQGHIQEFPFRNEKTHQCRWGDNFIYMMNFQVENMSANLYETSHKNLLKLTKKRGICTPFPQWARGPLIPFSYIDYEARWEELHIHTYHAFPEQQTIIKTQSLFAMK